MRTHIMYAHKGYDKDGQVYWRSVREHFASVHLRDPNKPVFLLRVTEDE